jgi:glycosyltransferase involved in cell wall biosynthesis
VTTSQVDGIEVVRINNLYAESSSFPWIYKNQSVHDIFERQLVDFRPDLVHIHHLTGLSTTIVETIKAGGLPLVMTLHDFWTVCPRGQRMTRELDLCENVDRNLCFHCLGGIWPQFFTNRAARARRKSILGGNSLPRISRRSIATFSTSSDSPTCS